MLTAEQKKERLSGIGGSDVGYIAGLSPYKTPLDIYLIKTGQREDDEINNEAIFWGNKLEPTISEVYAERHGVEVFKPENSIVHPEYYWMRCNLDFVVKGGGTVGEVKTTGSLGKEWGEELTEEMPYPFMLQCAHNAIVSEHLYNTERVVLPVFSGGFGGLKQKLYIYERDKELEKNIINMERIFWKENVEKRMPPMPVNMKDASILYPPREDVKKIATEEDMAIVRFIQDIRSRIKELDDEQDKQRVELCKRMEGAASLLDEKGKKLASWIERTNRSLDKKSFKEKRPDAYAVYEEFLEETKSKSLRVN